MSERVHELRESKMKKVVRAYERGTPMKSIASLVGVSPPTVSKWLIEEGYKRKRKGRIPKAMKERVKDLSNRGWKDFQISEFLKLSIDHVREFSGPIKNPILGGEKDPLKLKGSKSKAKGSKGKRGRPPKGGDKKKPGWPPPRHKCRKHWNTIEETYVLQMIEDKIEPAEIYKRMRASKSRQRRIWKKYGGKGNPPNFPPPRGPFKPPPVAPDDAKARRAEVRAISDASLEQLKRLELEADERKRKIAELESDAEKEAVKIKQLQHVRDKLREESQRRLEQAEAARGIIDKRRKPATPGPERVLPGSYEEAMGQKVGSLKAPKKKGRRALPAVGNGKYADNGLYFTVSKAWPQLRNASQDEIEVYAAYLDTKGFPARATPGGELPSGYISEEWSDKIDSQWEKVNSEALNIVNKYRARKIALRGSDNFSKPIIRYLVAAYDAYRNPRFRDLDDKKKEALRENVLEQFARAKKVDRLIMIFALKVAEPDGKPTANGIDRGFAARALLEKQSRRAAARLDEKKEALPGKPRRAISHEASPSVPKKKVITEDDVVQGILDGLITGDESEDEIAKILSGSVKALKE